MAFSLQSVKDEVNVVRIEDDGNVGYAYYVADGIEGFVWLYNIAEPPSSLEEQRGVDAPLNPPAYVQQVSFTAPTSSDDFDFNWLFREGAWECGIYIRGRLHAVLGKGDYPGWCVLAARDGPLAHRLEGADQ